MELNKPIKRKSLLIKYYAVELYEVATFMKKYKIKKLVCEINNIIVHCSTELGNFYYYSKGFEANYLPIEDIKIWFQKNEK